MNTAFPSIRQLCSIFIALMVISAVAGCVVLPSTTEGPWKDEVKKQLKDKNMEDANATLGEPNESIVLPEVTYHFYMGQGTQKYLILAHPLLTALSLSGGEVIWPVHPKEEDISQCLMLEVRDEKIVRAEVKSSGTVYDFKAHKTCSPLFWEVEEYRQIAARADQFEQEKLARRAESGDYDAALAIARKYRELKFLKTVAEGGDRETIILLAREFNDTELLHQLAKSGDLEAATILARNHQDNKSLYMLAKSGNLEAATMLAQNHQDKKPLYMLAYTGNVEAAAALAEKFGEHDLLKSYADSGNPEALAAYRRISCSKIFYPAQAGAPPERSDRFVVVCQGDRLSRERTVVSYGDWGPDEPSGYRTYFETIPASLR